MAIHQLGASGYSDGISTTTGSSRHSELSKRPLLVLTEQLVTSALSLSNHHSEQLPSDDRRRGASRFLIVEKKGA
jgi:hypothetical protein